jgi:hypothetical protein
VKLNSQKQFIPPWRESALKIVSRTIPTKPEGIIPLPWGGTWAQSLLWGFIPVIVWPFSEINPDLLIKIPGW